MKEKIETILFIVSFGWIFSFIGSTIHAYKSRKGIIKMMEYYEKKYDDIEDPVEREAKKKEINNILSWSIRKVLWGPNSI